MTFISFTDGAEPATGSLPQTSSRNARAGEASAANTLKGIARREAKAGRKTHERMYVVPPKTTEAACEADDPVRIEPDRMHIERARNPATGTKAQGRIDPGHTEKTLRTRTADG